jgi:UDP-N-acetylmuramoyl-tripeptide--D-alanyl-D-alanine ligase
VSEPLWTLDDMAAAMTAMRAGSLPRDVPGLSIDTRTLKPGEAFFAIQGENRDGHDFVEAALKSGAGLAIVAAAKQPTMPQGAPLLVVPDVLAALNDLARASRARSAARIVAVTGSVGKTGTKEALRLVLARQGETHASAASYNNHWGVPLSLALMPRSARYGVFEIGMNHAGEITPLTALVRPHVAIVTTIAPVHLEFFGTLDAIADAKAEIFSGVEPDGAAVINHDIAQYKRLAQAACGAGIGRIVSFGERAGAQARLMKVSLQAETSTVQAHILGHDVTYKLGAPGRHVVDNSLGVLAAAQLLGADLALAALALGALKPPAGRGERVTLDVPGGAVLLIDESYNANPTSMRAALALLGQVPTKRLGRRIAVLGDMLELGPDGAALHAELGAAVQ